MIEALAARRRPFKQLHRAIDRHAFLIAGDEQRERSPRFCILRPMPLDIGDRGGGECGDGALHVRGAAAVDAAIRDFRREGFEAPARRIARRHDVGVPSEGEMRRACADLGEEIVDVGRARRGEDDSMRLEADRLQRLLDDVERAGVGRRHGRTADEFAGKRDSAGLRHLQASSTAFRFIAVARFRRPRQCDRVLTWRCRDACRPRAIPSRNAGEGYAICALAKSGIESSRSGKIARTSSIIDCQDAASTTSPGASRSSRSRHGLHRPTRVNLDGFGHERKSVRPTPVKQRRQR